MKIIFMGTPTFAVETFKRLLTAHTIVAVVTQPDKPNGRGKKIIYSPIKEAALAEGLPVLQPTKARDEDFIHALSQFEADLFVVVAYGQILPMSILTMPKYGCVNVHGSLLPAYRGAAPIQWAVLNGDTKTGVTIMYMDKGMDTGDMILKREMPIEADDTYGTLHDRMSVVGADALIEALASIENGTSTRQKQDDSQSTHAPMIHKSMGKIDWSKTSADIMNLVKGLNPTPNAYTEWEGNVLKIWKAVAMPAVSETIGEAACGEVIDVVKGEGIVVKTGDGALLLTEVQGQGGKKMSMSDYLRGHVIGKGVLFR